MKVVYIQSLFKYCVTQETTTQTVSFANHKTEYQCENISSQNNVITLSS